MIFACRWFCFWAGPSSLISPSQTLLRVIADIVTTSAFKGVHMTCWGHLVGPSCPTSGCLRPLLASVCRWLCFWAALVAINLGREEPFIVFTPPLSLCPLSLSHSLSLGKGRAEGALLLVKAAIATVSAFWRTCRGFPRHPTLALSAAQK